MGVRVPLLVLMAYLRVEDQRAASRRHYDANKERLKQRAKEHDLEKKEYIRGKKRCPCADCGVQYPYYVMQFDHLPEFQKLRPLALMWERSWKDIDDEIAKCEVVCANCHAERTFQRTQATDAGPTVGS